MSRRRYITTLISVDKRVRQLSDPAALLYTWMIPHAEEDATITADAEELAATVMPNRKNWDTTKIDRACREISALDLLVEHQGRYFFPPVPFYRIQSNIHVAKRRTWHPEHNSLQNTQNSGEQRETAENSASPSPSPSPSPSKHLSDKSDAFDAFWNTYPRKVGKGKARDAHHSALKKADAAAILSGLKRQLPTMRKQEPKFVPHPATWLNQERWADEVEQPASPAYVPWVAPDVPDVVPMPDEVRDLFRNFGKAMP